MLEIKGKEREQDKTKWESAELWCEALNSDKDSWGEWKFRVIKNKPTIKDLFIDFQSQIECLKYVIDILKGNV